MEKLKEIRLVEKSKNIYRRKPVSIPQLIVLLPMLSLKVTTYKLNRVARLVAEIYEKLKFVEKKLKRSNKRII